MRKKHTRDHPFAIVRERAVNAYRIRQTLSAATLRGTVVAAADFKTNCLALMDEVQDTGAEFVITKHNKPVARLVPVLEPAGTPFIGRGVGIIAATGDIVAPTAPDWDEGADI
jgi:prevent-host-death family protein